MQFYTLNVVIILFDLTSNSESSGIHNQHVSPKDPPNASPPPNINPLEHEHIGGNKTRIKKKKSISYKHISNIKKAVTKVNKCKHFFLAIFDI